MDMIMPEFAVSDQVYGRTESTQRSRKRHPLADTVTTILCEMAVSTRQFGIARWECEPFLKDAKGDDLPDEMRLAAQVYEPFKRGKHHPEFVAHWTSLFPTDDNTTQIGVVISLHSTTTPCPRCKMEDD